MKQQSPNWDKCKDTSTFVEEGFPFSEGFPSGSFGRKYHLITRDGQHHRQATLNLSTQYRAEGPTWKSATGIYINPATVIAWKQED